MTKPIIHIEFDQGGTKGPGGNQWLVVRHDSKGRCILRRCETSSEAHRVAQEIVEARRIMTEIAP